MSESEVLLEYGELLNTCDTVVVQGNEKIENFAFLQIGQNWRYLRNKDNFDTSLPSFTCYLRIAFL